MNICEAIEKNAKRRPDHPAIMNSNGSVMTYSEYWQSVNAWATAMQNIGIGARDIIGVNLQDTSNHLIALDEIPLKDRDNHIIKKLSEMEKSGTF